MTDQEMNVEREKEHAQRETIKLLCLNLNAIRQQHLPIFYEVIPGFASCFNCKKALHYESSTKYMKSHNCIPSTTINEGPLAKYLNNKKVTDVQKQDKDQMKQKLTQWICSSVPSFSIIEDFGLNEVIQEAVRIGQKYTNPVNVNDILVKTDSIANHVRCLAEQYRQSLKLILIEQAEAGVLCINPDLWRDKYLDMNKEIQDNYSVALKQSNVTGWLSLSSLLESIEISIEHARSIISSKPAAVKQKVCINKINIESIKDLVCLLKPFKHVSTLVQTGDTPSLHMVYVAINKLELHLEEKDIDQDGKCIIIDARHE
ncbi:unnamed protein product, partial [Didymodactylos carnosus]